MTPAGELALHPPAIADETEVEEGYEEWARQEIEAGIADFEAGRTVSGDQVREWLESWGTSNELPPPLN